MRPPHFTGENLTQREMAVAIRLASMRPPHFTGENTDVGFVGFNRPYASMRPPHFTGENRFAIEFGELLFAGFNEAPAFHGGKSAGTAHRSPAIRASMRPPHFTGENLSGRPLFNVLLGASMRPPHFTGENVIERIV